MHTYACAYIYTKGVACASRVYMQGCAMLQYNYTGSHGAGNASDSASLL